VPEPAGTALELMPDRPEVGEGGFEERAFEELDAEAAACIVFAMGTRTMSIV
jgi:hypothetical protein